MFIGEILLIQQVENRNGKKEKTLRDVRSEEDIKPDAAFERLAEGPSPHCAAPPSQNCMVQGNKVEQRLI